MTKNNSLFKCSTCSYSSTHAAERLLQTMESRSSSRLLHIAFSVFSFVCIVEGEKCNTLNGKWYNQLGSEIFLEHGTDGILYGEYRTAVERRNGSAGVNHSIVLGKIFSRILIEKFECVRQVEFYTRNISTSRLLSQEISKNIVLYSRQGINLS